MDDSTGVQNQSVNNQATGNGNKGRYTVTVIRDKCIGAASCVAVAPNTFKLDDENKAIVLAQKLDSDENLLLSAQSCPTAAIVVTDDETGEQIWPK
jgi:ferredoxin